MPMISRMGRALMGVGMSPISVDGRVVPGSFVGGWGGWLDTQTIVIQDMSAGAPRVIAIDADSGEYRVLAARGANRIVAGDGVWAIWSTDLGYQDSFGRMKPAAATIADDWFPLDCYDGQIVVQPVYHGSPIRQSWNGLRVSSDVPYKWPYACGHVEGYGLCVWPHGDRTRGIVLSNDGHDFHPDLCVNPDGTIWVASSYTSGEHPSHLRTYLIDQAQQRVWTRPQPHEPQFGLSLVRADLTRPPARPDESPSEVPSFRPATHAIRVEVFGATGFNLALGDARHDDPQTPPWGVFCTLERDDVRAAVSNASSLGVPLFAYTDSEMFDDDTARQLARAGTSVISSVQYYPSGDHQAILDSLSRASRATSQVAIVAAAYRQIRGDGNYAWTVPQVLARLALAWERARVDPSITHFLIFHQNRANGRDGVVSRPEFIEAVSRLRAAAAAYRPPAPSPVESPASTPVPPPIIQPPVSIEPPIEEVPPVTVSYPPTRSAFFQEIHCMSETELLCGLVRNGRMLSVEPQAHSHSDTDIVRWSDLPRPEITPWEQVRIHVPDAATPDLVALDLVAAGKRIAIDDHGNMHLNPLTSWGSYEAFRGGTWSDGQSFVIRNVDVSRGGVTFTVVRA